MAKKLTNQELQTRLAFDFKVAMAMQCEVMTVSAYRNIDDLLGGKRKITAESEGHLAKYYLAEYNIKTLIGKGKYTTGPTRVQIDLLINGNYPFAEPRCDVVNSDLPWSPHFKQGYPICLGEIWVEAKGNILLGHLLIHISKLLNYDEMARNPGYVGWNGEAIKYWRDTLNEGPITSGLIYPKLPVDIAYGVNAENSGSPFKAVGSNRSSTNDGGFKPKSRT